jgi:tRNA-specific 2-thiouridylase
MKPKVAVAVSGGVDSLMAAYILKDQGYPLVGLHFVTGYEKFRPDVSSLAAQIGVPVEVVDISQRFDEVVVDYFVRTYLAGKTPNPCLVCNPHIKFDLLYRVARQRQAQKIATGHYARIDTNAAGQRRLLRGLDPDKDQSYFLAFLTQQHLRRALFPLGSLRKAEVKKWSSRIGLRPLTPAESQDVCFTRGRSYAEFLAQKADLNGPPGDIVDAQGHKLGVHNGLHRFTIGQRRGINCPADQPYYVLELDTRRNRLVVGRKSQTFVSECRVAAINWIRSRPEGPLGVRTRVRYRHRAADSILYPEDRDRVRVVFDRRQSAVTPGQGAVFYCGEEVIGGGFICNANR